MNWTLRGLWHSRTAEPVIVVPDVGGTESSDAGIIPGHRSHSSEMSINFIDRRGGCEHNRLQAHMI